MIPDPDARVVHGHSLGTDEAVVGSVVLQLAGLAVVVFDVAAAAHGLVDRKG